MKEFIERHFGRIMFVILTAIVTTMAILFNYMTNNGYGSFLNSDDESPRRYYHDNDSYNRNRDRSNRQPWKMQKPSSSMQKPSSSNSSKSSSSSGHK